MEKELKTNVEFVEKIYERIRAFDINNTSKDIIKSSTNILQKGENFVKYG